MQLRAKDRAIGLALTLPSAAAHLWFGAWLLTGWPEPAPYPRWVAPLPLAIGAASAWGCARLL